MGRPKKDITPVVEKVEEYAAGAWRDRGDAVPTGVGAAIYAGVTRAMLLRYAKTRPALRYTLDSILDLQRHELIRKGLLGEYNSNIVKLMLSHNHGFIEKREKTIKKRSKITVVRRVVKASGPEPDSKREKEIKS